MLRKASYDLETEFLRLSTVTFAFDSLTPKSQEIIIDQVEEHK